MNIETAVLVSSAKIMVVDDVKENLELLVKFLELEGYDVSFAMDGKKAIKLASLSPPDLILLDIMMPGIDGFETCRQLKAIKATRDIPIIFVTGKSAEEDIVEGFNLGAVDYITKPINQKELQVRVKNQLQLNGFLKIRDELIDELKQHNQQTEKFLAIKSQQLIEAQKLAALGELVAQLCHEVSTPIGTSITAVTSSACQVETIKSKLESQKLTKHDLDDLLTFEQESQKIIEANLHYAAELMASFKQVAVDQFTEEESNIELFGYLNQIVRILKPSFKRTNHNVEICCDEAIHICTIPSAFSQVLINLINNSLKHAFKEIKQGAMTITLTTAGDELTLVYTDNGSGIAPDHLPNIFDKYFTTAKEQGGTGVGLYIVKEIIEKKLSGKISCQSELGQGVEFTIKLPIKRVTKAVNMPLER